MICTVVSAESKLGRIVLFQSLIFFLNVLTGVLPFNFVIIKAITLTHCLLVDTSNVICWTSPSVILGKSGLFCRFYSIFDKTKSC